MRHSSRPTDGSSRSGPCLSDLRVALAQIMDAGDIAGWMEEPNEAFGGSTPLQVVERGEIDRLWQMIYAVQSGQLI